ncbi:MAG TPA: SUMF1/EgtB/PvdO family nonheme iron enzyme [Chthoniobacterales bacterium]|nr:SUMF1/EgtB/PvdO family nonheme iron enzyme [Chthoniobacterales bacterium]
MLQMAHSYTNPFRSITKLGFVMVLLMLSPLGAKDNGVNASPISIDLVTVGDLGNIADTSTHHGSVGECFRIGKYDLKASEYCAFLNAVARKNDPHNLYNEKMGSDVNVAVIVRSGTVDNYSYSVIPGRENFPIVYVNWFSSARFCNWMHHGQPFGRQGASTTESGAYTLSDTMNAPVSANPEASYFIPTEDQWYKAAYYQGAGLMSPYWLYATGADASTPPGNVIGDRPNQANYCINTGSMFYGGKDIFSAGKAPFITSVGDFSASPGTYGTYDMGGNVYQWMTGKDKEGHDVSLARGGAWNSHGPMYLQKTYSTNMVASGEENFLGVRIAAPFIKLVVVGDPGNTADPDTGYGAVLESYKIGKYPVTAGEYCTFLNAVATTDPYNLYDVRMGTDPAVASVVRTVSRIYQYSVIPGREDFPITYVNWFNAARFCNWMHNGCLTGQQGAASTETGAYTLNKQQGGVIVLANPAAKYRIPTEDQWYKAAYYKGGKENAGYWAYPTQSDAISETNIGIGFNQINYNDGRGKIFDEGTKITSVGLFKGSRGYYGTYDMGGSVTEWNDAVNGLGRPIARGGSFNTPSVSMNKSVRDGVPTRSADTGFRIVMPL